MKSRRVTMYSCDFCKKRLLRKDSMQEHEKKCIKNPARKCGFCASFEQRSGEFLCELSVPEMVDILVDRGIDILRLLSRGCPGCMLAAIVQAKQRMVSEYKACGELCTEHDKIMSIGDSVFNYQNEKAAFWKSIESLYPEEEWCCP